MLHAQTTVRVPLTVAHYSIGQYGYCRLDAAGSSLNFLSKNLTLLRRGRLDTLTCCISLLLILRVSLHFLANRLALLRRRRLDTLTCRFSSLLILRVSLNFLADCLVLLRRSRLITLTSGVLLLLGQWLATAEVAEVVIAPIVFSFIKPLCRCLTLGISRNDGGGVCSLLKLTCCRLTLAVACWSR